MEGLRMSLVAQDVLTAIVEDVDAKAYAIPTDGTEADGTLSWDSVTLVVAHVTAGGKRGMGYTYADAGAAATVNTLLSEAVKGLNAMDVPACWTAMRQAIRNDGESGIAAMAVAAVDCAMWDLKAKLLGLPLAAMLGQLRKTVPVYGSGGFTSYSLDRLRGELEDWVVEGITRVKMKIGLDIRDENQRVRTAREAIGSDVELFADANGAFDRKAALAMADILARYRVSWFEEPVHHADLEGLRLLRDRCPSGMEVAAGEYGFNLWYFRRMAEAGAVDVLQADASRCGITGFLQAAALCEAFNLPMSAHGAPSLHLHPCCAAGPIRHMEHFHDHVRIEHMLFDGVQKLSQGTLQPDLSRPGLGLELKIPDAERYEA